MHIRQRDESMESFIIRFNKERLQIPGLSEELACTAFTMGVNDDGLLRKLHGLKGYPQTMDEMMTIAKAYVKQEKSIAMNHAVRKKQDVATNSESNREHQSSRNRGRSDSNQHPYSRSDHREE